jgi:hypothetical protein
MPENPILTPEQRAEIRARAEAATPGPWLASHRCVDRTPDDDESCGLGLEIDGPPEAYLRGQFARSADAQFIAAARTDIPALLDTIEALEQRVAELEGRRCGNCRHSTAWEDEDVLCRSPLRGVMGRTCLCECWEAANA